MTTRVEKDYTRCQASYPHASCFSQLYDFVIGQSLHRGVLMDHASRGSAEGVLYGDWLAYTHRAPSAHSRLVSASGHPAESLATRARRLGGHPPPPARDP